jgi:hypothetical protein
MKENIKIIIGVIIAVILSSTIAVTATTLLQASSVSYDNTTVDVALDNLFDVVDLQEQIDNIFDKIYPVGSIYISTSSTNPSSLFGGTWKSYGTGRTLVGAGSNGTTSYEAGSEGGNLAGTATLKVANLPSHTHTVTAAGTISSTFTGKAVTSGDNSTTPTASFKGTAVTSGNNSVEPSATFSGTKGTTSSNGSHTHNAVDDQGATVNLMSWPRSGSVTGANGYSGWGTMPPYVRTTTIASAGSHTHTLTPSGTVSLSNTTHTHSVTAKGTVSLSNTTHTHSVTAKGTVSSTFTGTEVTSSATGSGTAFSTQDAYVVVYIWKRTK